MAPIVVSGSCNPKLAAALAAAGGVEQADVRTTTFPDGERDVAVDPAVCGEDVYVLQPLGPPADQHLFEMLLLADACRRAGAARLTALIPYLAYARQDRRTSPGEPVSIAVVAAMLEAAGFERVVAVDPHNRDLEAILPQPVYVVTAVPVLAAALSGELGDEAVVVAPDLGAVKLAEQYAEILGTEVTIVRKTRLSGDEVETAGVIGDVTGRVPIVVDDMVSTGGTLVAAARAVARAGAATPLHLAVVHGLFVGPAGERLGGLDFGRFVVSDTLPPAEVGLPVETVSVADLLAETVRRLHRGQPPEPLLSHE